LRGGRRGRSCLQTGGNCGRLGVRSSNGRGKIPERTGIRCLIVASVAALLLATPKRDEGRCEAPRGHLWHPCIASLTGRRLQCKLENLRPDPVLFSAKRRSKTVRARE